MHHFLYCVENVIDGKVYVGKHSTENFDDGYIGSGVLLKRAIKKHGVENFQRHILVMCESSDEAYAFEKLIVDKNFVDDENTYNQMIGGRGFDNQELAKLAGSLGAQAYILRLQTDVDFRQCQRLIMSRMSKRMWKSGQFVHVLQNLDWTGKRHKEETKQKIGRTNSVHQQGSQNSRFGSVWINNAELQRSTSIQKEELDSYLSNGWIKGRKIKW